MQNFENSSLTEHLLCLNNTQLLKQNSTVNNKKSKIEKKRERKNSPQVVQDENYVKPNVSNIIFILLFNIQYLRNIFKIIKIIISTTVLIFIFCRTHLKN